MTVLMPQALRRVSFRMPAIRLFAVALFGCAALVTATFAFAETLASRAPIAFLSAPENGTVLFAKDADKAFSPGSLVKVMTAATVFEALATEGVRKERLCKVSEHAWRTGGAPSRGATMFAAIKSEIAVEDLLAGLLVHNANDAAIILAECLDGSEEAFAQRMNDYAETIGMTSSHFINPTGFAPDEGQPDAKTTARDLARLATVILDKHADHYGLFAQPEFTWNKIYQRNKNPLLGEIRQLDGLGAGQSSDGYAGLASVERNGRRVIAVVAGLSSDKNRLTAIREVVEGAWDYFQVQTLFQRGDEIAQARVFGGRESYVPLQAASDVDVLLPLGGTLDYRLRVVYSGPLAAPVKAGDIVGELRVVGKDGIVHRTKLATASAVEPGDTTARALDGLSELLFGWF
ncbi:D-alanyl-D-alanine carboxypeptidase family protein [Labrenzia sp. CE80]|uniref:D-alanyl-D-alanine carboxypeptidase family protein n=1 Tax=Labrenzia sp. CE80 TaxID=1788986 RepID=UPI001AD8AA77|nr:D-alanyl-D-alanine carboxypeptidase family protein [Labrenzia sp. CE80]